MDGVETGSRFLFFQHAYLGIASPCLKKSILLNEFRWAPIIELISINNQLYFYSSYSVLSLHAPAPFCLIIVVVEYLLILKPFMVQYHLVLGKSANVKCWAKT